MFERIDDAPGAAMPTAQGKHVREEGDLTHIHERFAAVWRYYETLSRDKTPPCKTAFDPIEIARALPYVNMMDVLPPRDAMPCFRFRVVGTAQTEWTKSDPTGRCLHEALSVERAVRLRETLAEVVAEEAPMLFKSPLPFDDRDHILVDILHLPFRGAEAIVGFVLSVFGYPRYEFE